MESEEVTSVFKNKHLSIGYVEDPLLDKLHGLIQKYEEEERNRVNFLEKVDKLELNKKRKYVERICLNKLEHAMLKELADIKNISKEEYLIRLIYDQWKSGDLPGMLGG